MKLPARLKHILFKPLRYISGENLNQDLFAAVSPSQIIPVITFLQASSLTRYNLFIDLVCVDFPSNLKRFELIYCLLSPEYNSRLFLKTHITETQHIQSVASLFMAANWFERQCYDFFGVFFNNHPDLRRILNDYGFSHFPLRKDFPLLGYEELRYTETSNRVISDQVELSQESKSQN